MKHRLALYGTWFTSEPLRMRVVVLVLATLVALAISFIPNGVALAGFASGGSG